MAVAMFFAIVKGANAMSKVILRLTTIIVEIIEVGEVTAERIAKAGNNVPTVDAIIDSACCHRQLISQNVVVHHD